MDSIIIEESILKNTILFSARTSPIVNKLASGYARYERNGNSGDSSITHRFKLLATDDLHHNNEMRRGILARTYDRESEGRVLSRILLQLNA